MSWATILLLLALNVGLVTVHAKMASPGLACYSVLADMLAWSMCALIQAIGKKD